MVRFVERDVHLFRRKFTDISRQDWIAFTGNHSTKAFIYSFHRHDRCNVYSNVIAAFTQVVGRKCIFHFSPSRRSR